jgi:hypothetical protein
LFWFGGHCVIVKNVYLQSFVKAGLLAEKFSTEKKRRKKNARRNDGIPFQIFQI